MPDGTHDDSITVGGKTPLTTVDFPGRLACVLFCQGCPWRCPYCHNAHLRSCTVTAAHDWADVMAFLTARVGLLDGVVFSGGEPLLQPGLAQAMDQVRDLGFEIALHTGGYDPNCLQPLLDRVDWVGFDAKAPFDDYVRITGVRGSGGPARRSLEILIGSGVDYEVRTTVDPALIDAQALRTMGRELAELGVTQWVLQEYRPLKGRPVHERPSPIFDAPLMAELAELIPALSVRHAD